MEILAFTVDFQTISRQFSAIADEIEKRWGSHRLVPYLRELIGKANDAGNVRPSEFPSNVVAAMEALSAKHESEYPTTASSAPEPEVMPAPEFDLRSSLEFIQINERFERLGSKIAVAWGTKTLSPFINQLLHDTRDGARQGFPPEVAKALFALMVRHDDLFPGMTLVASDIWTPKPPQT